MGKFDRQGASGVIIDDAIDPRTHGRESHQSSVVRLQHLRDDLAIGRPRIEPQVVTVTVSGIVNG